MGLPLEKKEGDEEWRGSCMSRLKDLGLFSLVKAFRGHYSSLQVENILIKINILIYKN